MTDPLVPTSAVDYLPEQITIALSIISDDWGAILSELEPLSDLKFGDAEEDYRQSAKEVLLAAALTIDHHRSLLDDAKRRIVGWLDEITLDGEVVVLDEVGRYRVGDSKRTTYDNERTASAFAARLSDEAFNRETGEVPPLAVTVERAVVETAKALGGLAPSKAWNKTPLRERGLDPKKFVATEERTDRRLMEER